MGGIGIVNNPRSRRNRRRPRIGRRLRAQLGDDGDVLDAATPEELARALETFRGAGVDVLGVNGGDGTAHFVLSAFARAYDGAPLPRVLLLPGGAMNTVARAHGIRGSPERTLWDIVTRRRAGMPLLFAWFVGLRQVNVKSLSICKFTGGKVPPGIVGITNVRIDDLDKETIGLLGLGTSPNRASASGRTTVSTRNREGKAPSGGTFTSFSLPGLALQPRHAGLWRSGCGGIRF